MAITLTFKISDDDQKLLKDNGFIIGDAGIDEWLQKLVTGNINKGYKLMRNEYDPILFDDESVSSVPSDKEKYINLVTARSDYKAAKDKFKT